MAIRFTRDFISVFLHHDYDLVFVFWENYRSDNDIHDVYVCTVPAFCDGTALSIVGSVLSSLRSVVPALRLVPDSDIYVSNVSIPSCRVGVVKVVLRS